MFSRWQIRVLLIATVLFGVGIGLLMAAIPNQGRTQFFGSSGGNVNNIGKFLLLFGHPRVLGEGQLRHSVHLKQQSRAGGY